MAQISVAIKCKICNELLSFSDGIGPWGFIEEQSKFMQSHDKCEKIKESFEQTKKVIKPGAKVGAKHANRSTKS